MFLSSPRWIPLFLSWITCLPGASKILLVIFSPSASLTTFNSFLLAQKLPYILQVKQETETPLSYFSSKPPLCLLLSLPTDVRD